MQVNYFYILSPKEKELIFQDISNKSGKPAFAVEKDWWVTQTLAIIFEMEAGNHLIFKVALPLVKRGSLFSVFPKMLI